MPAPLPRAARWPHLSRRVPRAALALAIAGLAALAGLGLPASAAPAPVTQADPALGVVVIGAGGLQWSDVDRADTPTLWRLLATGSVGSISVRTAGPRKCPLDAWSTLSSGRRWSPPPPDVTDGSAPTGTPASDQIGADGCTSLPTVIATDAGTTGPSPHVIEGWSALVAAPADGSELAAGEPGTLAARLAAVGACSTAAGPGAALALADADGRVERYVADPGQLRAADLAACRVVMVDTGELGDDRADRRDALRSLDATVGLLARELPAGWRVVVAGVSDGPTTEDGLPFVVDWQRGGPVGWLTSDSTRTAGIVTLTDLAATAASTVGADLTEFDGTPLATAGDRRMSADRTVENRRYLTEMTTTVSHVMPVFVVVVVLAALAAALALVLSRRRQYGRPGLLTRRIAPAVLLLVASAPAGAFAAALSRWWVSSAPLVGAAVSAVIGTVAFALAAWFGSRALPAGRWRLAGASAGLTWLLLTVDGLTGTQLQQGSILGSTPTFGARFYGFGNLAFSVYAAGALVLAGFLAAAVEQRGRRRLAPALALGIGVVTIVIDGWPGFGADVGGILALVPAFVVLALGVGGMRLTVRRALAAGAAGFLATAVVGVIDWLGPWQSSHLGLFVQRVVDGQALPVIEGKAAGAWATVANPAGVLATLACVWAVAVLVGPERWRPVAVREAYRSWPMLRPVVGSVVVAATMGTLLNDSGIAVGVVVLGLSAALLAASAGTDAWVDAESSGTRRAGVATDTAPGRDAPVRRMPAVLLATGGGLLALLLLGVGFSPFPVTAAGDVTSGEGAAVAAPGTPLVVIGTAGLRWQDVSPAATPTLWGMVRDGAAVTGVAPGITGPNGRCASAGWLALSSGKPPLTTDIVDGARECAPWDVVPDPLTTGGSDPGASVPGWAGLAQLQSGSPLAPHLGLLGESLAGAGACTTAVGPGAALALAGADGRVARYRSLDAAVADPTGTFGCPVTLVDLGAVPYQDPTDTVDPAADPAARPPTSDGPARTAALGALDSSLRGVLAAVPADAAVLLVDVGNPARAAISLGVGVGRMPNETGAHFLSTPSTRWEGVVRLLDVPTTMLTAVGAGNPADFTGSPLNAAGTRTTDARSVVDQLVDLSVRDQALRGRSTSVTTVPFLVALVLFALAVLVMPRLRRRRPSAAGRLRTALDGAFLLLASLPAGAYLMTASSWWRADQPVTAMWLALAASTLVVAGLGALAPWRPIWAAPAVVSALTFALLTADASLGTPLHRGSPLGPAPTLGGRYYGFGNPTYSIYAVAALLAAAGIASALLARGRRRLAVVVSGAVALLALAVDLLPSLGADVGGGLVLLPAMAVVVLAVASARVTWSRMALIGVVGVIAVAVIGLLDWLRPAADRTHLGRFVQSAIDGTAWATVARKAGYAASTVTSGPIAWITIAVLVGLALLLWRRGRVRGRWFDQLDAAWTLVRPVTVGLLIAAVGGSLANDYGTRIATGLLAVAVPMLGLLLVRSVAEHPGPPPESGH